MGSDVRRYQANLQDELNGSALYAALAAAEAEPLRKDLFLQLAQAETNHAQLWRDKLTAAGVQDERFVPAFRTRLLAKLAQRFGPRFVLATIAAAEYADRNKYAGQRSRSNRIVDLTPHIPGILLAASQVGPGRVVTVGA